MLRHSLALSLLLMLPLAASAGTAPVDQWWKDVSVLADDNMEVLACHRLSRL